MGLLDNLADSGLIQGAAGFGQGFLQGQERAEDRKYKRMEMDAKHAATRIEKEKVDSQKKFEQEEKLRDDWQKNHTTIASQQVQEAYRRIQNAPNSPAGDMSLIYGINKIMDPGSTVREGEFANAQATTSAMGQLQAAYKRVMTGERLTPQQRQDFLNTAARLHGAQHTQQNQFDDQYRGLARGYGNDPDKVVLKIFEDPQTGEQKVMPVPAPQGGMLGKPKGMIAKPKALAAPKSGPKDVKDIDTMSDAELKVYLGR